MQLTSLEPIGSKHKGTYTDGKDTVDAVFGNKANLRIQDGDITSGSILKLITFVCNTTSDGVHKLITTEMALEAPSEHSTAQEGSAESGPEPMQAGSPSKENQPSNVKTEENIASTGTPLANKKPKLEHTASKTPRPIKKEPDTMKTPAHPRIASLASSSRTPQPSPSEQYVIWLPHCNTLPCLVSTTTCIELLLLGPCCAAILAV